MNCCFQTIFSSFFSYVEFEVIENFFQEIVWVEVQALSAVSTQREFDSALRGLRDAVAQNIDFNFGLATHVRTHHELKDEL